MLFFLKEAVPHGAADERPRDLGSIVLVGNVFDVIVVIVVVDVGVAVVLWPRGCHLKMGPRS